MKTQIRDLELIEKELSKIPVGILAIIIEHDKVVQLPVRFLYHDKNLFLFFSEDDELFSGIPFGAELSFTVVKSLRPKIKEEDKPRSTVTITISGLVKFVDDQKFITELRKHYNRKYKIHKDEGLKIIMIDTQEFLAYSHTEG